MIQKNVLEYLERSAALYPQKIAFSDEREALSFETLRQRAKSLGTALSAVNAGNPQPIAVLSHRSTVTLTAFFGILYSGNYYVPIDAKMPPERMCRILETLSPKSLLYAAEDEATAKKLERYCSLTVIEAGCETTIADETLQKRRQKVLDIDPVYAIFTSGSTGTPKGIPVSHRSVIDFTEWMAEAGEFTERDVMGNQAPFHFDLSVKDIYLTLKCGATTHIIPQQDFLFPKYLMAFLETHGVTALIWVTSAFHLVANSGILDKNAPTHLRTVILGGDVLRARQLNIWRRALPQVRYMNLYGPTEVTVDCTFYPIEREFADTEPVPIGYACANKEVFLLDADGKPVSAGNPGEICVRGIGLAKGYFGDWEKTRVAFIQDPRNPAYPDLIYRTGDMGQMDENGLLYFLSRRDGQIKHMGYRIELGEIETTLSALPTVGELVCLFDAENDRIHCIYTGKEDGNALAKRARSALPRYMVPNFYHRLDELPRNANGKIDRVRLKQEYLSEKN